MQINFSITFSIFLLFMLSKILLISTFYTKKTFLNSISSRLFAIKRINSKDFQNILNNLNKRQEYQIIDVREPNELEIVKFKDSNIINLPISESPNWTEKIKNGELLDITKPTICVCHHGMRSLRACNFLGIVYIHLFQSFIYNNYYIKYRFYWIC